MVGPVACITLNRTEANNRPNLRMAAELRDLSVELSADDGIRVVIDR
jgi:enoyl-CoA hydratase/carnithine racemase